MLKSVTKIRQRIEPITTTIWPYLSKPLTPPTRTGKRFTFVYPISKTKRTKQPMNQTHDSSRYRYRLFRLTTSYSSVSLHNRRSSFRLRSPYSSKDSTRNRRHTTRKTYRTNPSSRLRPLTAWPPSETAGVHPAKTLPVSLFKKLLH
jgi:hypothetical protein